MKFSRILLVAACLSAAAMTVSTPDSADAEVIDRIVARVNDQIVTFYELKQAVTPFMLQKGMDPSVLDDAGRRREIYQQVLGQLVDRQLLLQEADKLDLSVSDKQIDQWLAVTRKKQQMSKQQFRSMIKQYGMGYQAYRDMIRQNLLKMRLIKVKFGRQVSVSDDEVDKAYRETFGESGGKTKHIEVRHILVSPQADTEEAIVQARSRAQQALAELKDGAKFGAVAQTYSTGPSAEAGGYLGTFSRGELAPEFEKVAFSLHEGQLSGVVRTKFGFHVIEVMDVQMRADDNAEQRKKKLRAKLRQEAVQNQLQAYVQKLRARSFVEVSY